ncbi:DUF4136 domain-containing protein [Geothrix sp. 21YS21S-4]|uniref:DUF4136 domain-containing protein n=1 Tax=Geothrix sp. 21YS21S-4 TaxID=3068889 RepID=UPI0027B8E71F|nr:DUF4136 domain-containing protein [Geothrix sp. 21YS21S-4]
MIGPASALSALLLLFGCSQPRFVYRTDPAFRGGAYRTVALDLRTDQVLIREGFRPVDPGFRRQAVLSALTARGYRPEAAGTADLWVAVHLLVEAREEGSAGPSRPARGAGRRGGGGPPRGEGAPRDAGERRTGRGTLLVQLLDPKTGQALWQGESPLERGDRDSEEVVRKLLEPLPSPRP